MINIKGKDYVTVNERLTEFRAKYKDWSLTSELVNLTEDSCIIKAIITDDKGVVRATGYAQEDRMSSMINKTSFVENCETSAWGRALGNLGIGIIESVASADEVSMAIKKQNFNNGIAGDFIMPHGKHAGKALSEISPDYLDWYLDKGTSENVKENIKLMRTGLKEVDL